MKKVINRKRYDTETAKRVALWSTGGSMSDFRYASEDLYRKKTGEFFIHGEGGPMTRWGKSSDGGNTRGWGEDIQPLSIEEAKDWVERYSNDNYEDIFGEVEE